MKENIVGFTVTKDLVRKSAINSVIFNLLIKLKGIIVLPIITFLLEPSELGIYYYVLVFASLLAPVFILNLADGPAIYLVQEKEVSEIRKMYLTVFNVSLILAFPFLIIFNVISKSYDLQILHYFWLFSILLVSQNLFKITSYLLSMDCMARNWVH